MTNREKYILSIYEELSDMGKHENVKLVKNTVNDGIYIKKTLKNYNIEIYKILLIFLYILSYSFNIDKQSSYKQKFKISELTISLF